MSLRFLQLMSDGVYSFVQRARKYNLCTRQHPFFSTSKPHVDKFANTPSLLDLPCKSAWRSVTTQAEKRYGVKHLISANVRILHANLRARARSFWRHWISRNATPRKACEWKFREAEFGLLANSRLPSLLQKFALFLSVFPPAQFPYY